MASSIWKKTISTPFKKACTFFNQQPDHQKIKPAQSGSRDQKTSVMALQGEVMACGYEDVQVMWSILDKSRAT